MDLIDGLAERAMWSGRRVGLVVGYQASGREAVASYGHVGTVGSDPPGPGTLFEIGSITRCSPGCSWPT